MIFKIFSSKTLAFFAKTADIFCKNLIITLVFEKSANFFDENWQKWQKIVIITSTPAAWAHTGTPVRPPVRPRQTSCNQKEILRTEPSKYVEQVFPTSLSSIWHKILYINKGTKH
jgi:hypothetical protein